MVKTAAICNFARPKARFAFAQNSALAFEIVLTWDFAKRSHNRRSFARVAFANSRSFDRFAMNRGQNCGYSQILARFNARLVFARFALFAALTFEVLFTWDFAETANL